MGWKKLILNGDVALRINPTIYCINFYFLKQYIVYKSFSATAPFFLNYKCIKIEKIEKSDII